MTNTKDMAKTLVQFALKNGTQDNVSVLVLRFKWWNDLSGILSIKIYPYNIN